MEIRPAPADPVDHQTPLLAFAVFEDDEELSPFARDLDRALDGAIARARDAGDLDGEEGRTQLFHATGDGPGAARVLAVGVGGRDDYDVESVRSFAGRAVRQAEKRELERLTLHVSVENGLDPEGAARAATEGAVLAAWRFRELKTSSDDGDASGRGSDVAAVDLAGIDDADALDEGIRIGAAQARGENFTRTLQQRPGNVATPSHLADEATAMAERVGLEVRVFGPDEMREEGMEALLGVASGSTQEPRMIVLEHRGGAEDDPPLVLVGKGITFDAGGISIKPSKGMESMKFDMSGGAAVLGALQAVAELDLPLNVAGIVPTSENLPSGSALKPGDVLRTREGKTVEVVNTDAEGRLILSDALSWAQTLDPAAIVDCATLTGSCVVALGHHAAGLMGNDDGLLEELREAGERSGERCWPLPIWEPYRKQLESETADFKNVGGRPAGAITAACFLREFVGDATWAHLDVAGTAYGDEPRAYLRKGAYGVPTRLLVEWVRARAG